MKFLIGIFTAVLFGHLGISQTVPSSCSAPTNIVSSYYEDAQKLTMRKFLAENSTYLDSIHIPTSHSDTILNALIAVYNATGLPARDTVVSIYGIHTLEYPTTKLFSIQADTSLAWMDSLNNGVIPTGNNYIDSLISAHYLSLTGYYEFGNIYDYHSASFESDSSYNLLALGDVFMQEPMVYSAGPNAFVLDGGDITDTIHSDHVELTYSIGWGDCMSGCICKRYWVFRVYFDCSVEYVESYGCIITYMNSESEILEEIELYPNPIKNQFSLTYISEPVQLEIFNQTGQLILFENSYSGEQLNLENSLPGIYYVRISSGQNSKSMRLVKL